VTEITQNKKAPNRSFNTVLNGGGGGS